MVLNVWEAWEEFSVGSKVRSVFHVGRALLGSVLEDQREARNTQGRRQVPAFREESRGEQLLAWELS